MNAAASASPSASPQVLVVDDDPDIRRLLETALHLHGYGVTVAENGRQALELAAAFPFAWIITDLVMPDIEGIETILELRRRRHPARIIAMSGGSRFGARVCLPMARHLGAESTLPKPFTPTELLRVMGHSPARADPAPLRSFLSD